MATKTAGARNAYIEAGKTRLSVNTNDYTWSKAKDLRERTAAARRDLSVFAKHEREKGESEDAYRERIKPFVAAEQVRKEDEDDYSAYLKRVIELKSDVPELTPKFLEIIYDVFSLKTPTEDDMAQVSYIDLKKFIYSVLTPADALAGDFFTEITEV